MILASAPDVSPENDAMELFLGPAPLRVIGRSSEGRLETPRPGLEQDNAGSILVLAGSSADTMASRLPRLLVECHQSLKKEGRIAVLAGNRAYGCIRSLRSFVPGAGRTRGDRRQVRGMALGALLELVRNAGFVNVSAFAVSPSAENPEKIRTLSRWDTWRAPAFLVTAGFVEEDAGFLLEQIIASIEQMRSGEGNVRPGRSLSVVNSSRGKSVALVEHGESRIVVRVARSAVMLEDEACSYRLLQQIQGNSAVAHQVPRPLAADTVGNISFFAQSHVNGTPLSTKIRNSNRAAYLQEVNRFLRALNPRLTESPAVSLDDELAVSIIQPMTHFALQHVSDEALRVKASALLADSLRGATGRLGIVHGDLGPGNIMVEGNRIVGVIDWEAARKLGPPVLDAFNYLDSAHRLCKRNTSIVDTLPMLASGEWPIPGETEFLKEFFRYCGVDYRFRRGFSLLYAFFHFGPQLRFATTERGPKRRLEQVLQRLVMQ